MNRRQAIKAIGMGITTSACPLAFSGSNDNPETNSDIRSVYLVPGYHPAYAMLGSQTLDSHPDFIQGMQVGYQGPKTMVTRLNEADQSIQRTVFPISGHHIAISKNRKYAFFSNIDDEDMILFDTGNLELLKITKPHSDKFVGGGHAVFLPDNKHLVVTERYHHEPYSGKPEQHFGRITIRDAKTLKVLEVYSCGGINPHDIALMADGRHVAISNYGSTDWPENIKQTPYVVEPSVTVIDLKNGKLVHKTSGHNPNFELRHVAAHNMERIFAIQTNVVENAENKRLLSQGKEVIEKDLSSGVEDLFYAPAPLLALQFLSNKSVINEISPENELLFRQGQSIIYDPVSDEAIATFTSGNTIAIIDGKNRSIKKIIRTDELGLYNPRGVVFHPDGIHYVVSGSWRGLYLFKRNDHTLNRPRCFYGNFYDHSHLSIV